MDPSSITKAHEEDSGDEPDEKPTKRSGRRKIKIEYIEDKNRRHITFSKRKSGIMKKAYELSTLTGTQVLLLVVSETGLVYTFTTAKLQPIVTNPEGKNLIQACLNAPDMVTNETETQVANEASSPESNSVDEKNAPSPSSSSAGYNNNGVPAYPNYPAGQTPGTSENERPPSHTGYPQQHPHYQQQQQHHSTTQPSYGMPYYDQINHQRPPFMPPPNQSQEYWLKQEETRRTN